MHPSSQPSSLQQSRLVQLQHSRLVQLLHSRLVRLQGSWLVQLQRVSHVWADVVQLFQDGAAWGHCSYFSVISASGWAGARSLSRREMTFMAAPNHILSVFVLNKRNPRKPAKTLTCNGCYCWIRNAKNGKFCSKEENLIIIFEIYTVQILKSDKLYSRISFPWQNISWIFYE